MRTLMCESCLENLIDICMRDNCSVFHPLNLYAEKSKN